MMEVMKIMETYFKSPMQALLHSVPPTLQQATADPRLVWGHCSFLLSPGAQGSVCALQESVSLVLCKFWWLYGGVNGDLLQEGLCHTQVCCPQRPCPCSSPLLTHNSSGDTQTQFCLSLCASLGPGAHKVCLSPLSISGRYGV